MNCDVCKKNPAKLHITQVKDNEKLTLHICHECSHQLGVSGPAINTSFSIDSFLKEEGKIPSPSTSSEPNETVPQLTCSECGLSFNAFKESGRLGCARCYDMFIHELKPLLRKLHKSVKHIGKVPGQGDPQVALKRGINDIRLKLKEAVNLEHFEKAARLRDQIKQLESDLTHLENH